MTNTEYAEGQCVEWCLAGKLTTGKVISRQVRQSTYSANICLFIHNQRRSTGQLGCNIIQSLLQCCTMMRLMDRGMAGTQPSRRGPPMERGGRQTTRRSELPKNTAQQQQSVQTRLHPQKSGEEPLPFRVCHNQHRTRPPACPAAVITHPHPPTIARRGRIAPVIPS